YSDFLIVNVGWTLDSRKLSYQVQDRKQSWLDFNIADRATGRTTTLFRETSQTWVERWDDSSADPVWLTDGTFLWLSERSGRRDRCSSTRGAMLHILTRSRCIDPMAARPA